MQSFLLKDFATLPASAKELFASASQSSFFNSAAWFDLVTNHALDPGWRAQLVMADDSQTGMVLRMLPSGSAGTLLNAESLYCSAYDVLLGNADSGDVQLFAKQLVTQTFQAQALRLRGLNPDAAYFRELRDGFEGAGFVAKSYFDWAVWYTDVTGWDLEKYLSALPSSLRNTWRRKAAALAKSASTSITVYSIGDDIEPFIADYDRVQRQSWKKAEPYPTFIPNAIRRFAQAGVLRMGILVIDDTPAAAQFWIVSNGRASLFKLVYAESFSKHSPGTLLTMRMIESILAGDCPHEMDFGRGDDPYKKLWMGSRKERWGIEAANPKTMRGALQAARILAAKARTAILKR